jgi:hypothetical protein
MTARGLDHARLVKLCGMFGSDHAGERANAAAAADKLIREAGLRWPDVIFPALPSSPRRQHHVETAADAIEFLLDHEEELTAWERDFARSLRRQRSPISQKQITILEQLRKKVGRAAARAA